MKDKPREPTYEETEEVRYGLLGQDYPHSQWAVHDADLEESDRLAERLPHGLIHLAYRERTPRRERFDENRVRALTHPRSGQVEVQPRRCPLDEAA